MWTLWGNVYTPRDDDGSDKARELTGRDPSGHGTCLTSENNLSHPGSGRRGNQSGRETQRQHKLNNQTPFETPSNFTSCGSAESQLTLRQQLDQLRHVAHTGPTIGHKGAAVRLQRDELANVRLVDAHSGWDGWVEPEVCVRDESVSGGGWVAAAGPSFSCRGRRVAAPAHMGRCWRGVGPAACGASRRCAWQP